MERKQIKNKQFEIFKNTYFYKTPLVPAAVLKVTFASLKQVSSKTHNCNNSNLEYFTQIWLTHITFF